SSAAACAIPAVSGCKSSVMFAGDNCIGQTWQRRGTLLQSAPAAIAAARPGEIHIMLDIAFAKPALPKSGALVLLLGEGEMPSGVWQQADEATGGAIARALAAAEFKGGKGKTCVILAPGASLSRVIAVGLGKPAELTMRSLTEAGGHAAALLTRE